MPSWTPGSYLLREFARHVQSFSARDLDGNPLRWTKTDRGTWRVAVPEATHLEVVYSVYANELTVRTSHVDATHAYVNGASVFMFVRGRESHPVELSIATPAGWRIDTALEEASERRYRARDYDELVDSPIEAGTHAVLEWEQDGKPHRYAVWGRGGYHGERLVEDTRRIVDAAGALFGSLPYERYLFILHLLPDGRGGLEHRASTSLQADRWAFDGDEYESFLALVAHEFFHVWNAKRIRPQPLGPFDYTRENHTRNLWVVEGITTYYTDLLLCRAGLISRERYLTRLAESITRLRQLPGRHLQSLSEASFDAWIRFYRPDENTPNSQVSYYHKGALVALLLDLRIRAVTGAERSLDDVMRLLWERYGQQDAGFPEDGPGSFRALAEEVCGESLGGFFRAYVDGTDELDFERGLAPLGLRLVPVTPTATTGGPSLGLRTRDDHGRLLVTHVLAGSPAYRAGINAGDELLALDGLRVCAQDLPARLREGAAGDAVTLTVFRRDELMAFPVTLEDDPTPPLALARVPDPSEAQQTAYDDWLRGGA